MHCTHFTSHAYCIACLLHHTPIALPALCIARLCIARLLHRTPFATHAFCIKLLLHRMPYASNSFCIACLLHLTPLASYPFGISHRFASHAFSISRDFTDSNVDFWRVNRFDLKLISKHAKLVWSPCRWVTDWPQVSQVQIFSEAKKTRESEILPAAGLTTHKRTHPSQDSWHERPPELQ